MWVIQSLWLGQSVCTLYLSEAGVPAGSTEGNGGRVLPLILGG
jgi:hypothetical protein